MERKQRRPSLMERTAKLFDLPADALAGLPRLELVGDGELRLENHKGILAYGREEIHVSGGGWVIKIAGEGLEHSGGGPPPRAGGGPLAWAV